MNFFYTTGGGLGHLYRVKTFIEQFRIEDFSIIATNPIAYELFAQEQVLFLETEGEDADLALTRYFTDDFPKLSVTAFYIDTFPVGLIGELVPLKTINCPVYYLARRLRWKYYESIAARIPYSFYSSFVMEDLEEGHLQFVQQHTRGEVRPVSLNYPPPDPSRIPLNLLPGKSPVWLIVHAFFKEEVVALYEYARDLAVVEGVAPYWVVVSDQFIKVNPGICITYFPANDWFPMADRIFSGGGFNIMHQIMPFKDKHISVPFPRKYDDQAWRIRVALK